MVWVSVATVQKVGDLWLQEVGITQSEFVTSVLLKKDSFRVNLFSVRSQPRETSSLVALYDQVFINTATLWGLNQNYYFMALHGDGEHHQWLWDKVWFKSMASFSSGLLDPKPESFEGFLLKRHKNQQKGYHRGLSDLRTITQKRQWTLKLNTCKLSDMQENVHHQVLIGFKLLHLIDWEGFQSFIDHSLSEAK